MSLFYSTVSTSCSNVKIDENCENENDIRETSKTVSTIYIRLYSSKGIQTLFRLNTTTFL